MQVRQDTVAEAMAAGRFGPAALARRVREVREHYDGICERRPGYIARNAYYYNQLFRVLRFIIPPAKRVLQTGCLTPDFLNAVEPSFGVGIDLSLRQTELARQRFPHLTFMSHENYQVADLGTFDYVVITDLNDQADPLASLRALSSVMSAETRVVVQNYNHLWEPIIRFAQWLGLKYPLPQQNWLSAAEVANVLRLCDFEPLSVYRRVLFPKRIPLLSWFANSFLGRLPAIDHLNMICLTVARPVGRSPSNRDRSVSIVVPCRNEVGNIVAAVERIPDLGSHTEIIFCDDKSNDGTSDEIRRMQKLYSDRDIKHYDGPGISKALNVRTGFDHAHGEILMILDADLTTMPEELRYFYDVIVSGKAEFVNGSRFVFPMEGEAMRSLNIAGNRLFSAVFSFLLGQRITDTLCGTKALWRLHWPAIRALAGGWGTEDRWGDYDLLFGAAKLHLRVMDLPVHYQERVSGVTKMTKRFHNGLIMARMCWAAFLRFKLR
jgi:hypothetical protein